MVTELLDFLNTNRMNTVVAEQIHQLRQEEQNKLLILQGVKVQKISEAETQIQKMAKNIMILRAQQDLLAEAGETGDYETLNRAINMEVVLC